MRLWNSLNRLDMPPPWRPTRTRSEPSRFRSRSAAPGPTPTVAPTSAPAVEQAVAGETGLAARAVAGSLVTGAAEALGCVGVEEIPGPRGAARRRRRDSAEETTKIYSSVHGPHFQGMYYCVDFPTWRHVLCDPNTVVTALAVGSPYFLRQGCCSDILGFVDGHGWIDCSPGVVDSPFLALSIA